MELGTNETVDATGKLTVRQNVLASVDSKMITYVCEVYFYDTVRAVDSVCFTLASLAAKAKTASITGSNVFKYINEVVNPNTITLTAEVSNVTITKWQYKNASGSFVDISGTAGAASIVVRPTDSIWNNDIATIKLVTNDTDVFDVFSLFKVTNGNNGESGTSYYAYIRYSAYSDGHVMVTAPNSSTRFIGTYAGPQGDPAQLTYEDFTWSQYVGATLTVTGTKVEYIVSQEAGRPSDDASWSETSPNVPHGYYLWTRTTITFSNNNTMRTYNVQYGDSASTVRYYAHIRYSANADGSSMTSLPTDHDTAYIGIYTGPSQSAPISYTAYTWSRLNDNQLTALGSVISYAVTDTYNRPEANSSSWQSTMPTIGEGQYLWTKSVVTYSDQSTTTSYSVAYSGTNGENSSTCFLSNENISFASDADGKIPYTRMTTSVVGYNGTTKTKANVLFDYITGVEDGMSVSHGTDPDGEVQIVIQITEGSTFGGKTSGEIGIPVKMMNNGVETINTTLQLTWTKISNGTDGEPGVSPILMVITTPQGTVFDNHSGTLTAVAAVYKGAEDVTDQATYQWQKFANGSWSSIGETSKTLSVSGDAVSGIGLYRCRMTYTTETYTQTVTFIDKTDNYQAYIYSSGGDAFTETGVSTELICYIYQNGQKIEPAQATYSWTRIRSDGTVDPTFSASTKNITVQIANIGSSSTFVCETIGGTLAQITLVYSADIAVSDHAPENPSNGALWLDTSDNSNILYRWMDAYTKEDGTVVEAHWEKCTASVGDINALNRLIEQQADFFVNKDEIKGYVSTTQYDEDMRVVDERIGNMALSDSDFALKFISSGVRNTVQGDINSAINTYSQTVSKYLRYNGTTGVLSLGSEGDEHETFEAQLSQTKLSFIYRGEGSGSEGKEIAYVGINDMYITNARVTQALYIGYSDVGYFNWTVTETGIGLKWVGYDE